MSKKGAKMEFNETIKKAINDIRTAYCGKCRIGQAIQSLIKVIDPEAIELPAESDLGNPDSIENAEVKGPGGISITESERSPGTSAITKRCSRCKQEKPLDRFTRNASTKDGLEYFCRDCKKIDNREKRDKKKAAAIKKSDQIPPIKPDPDDGLFYCPFRGCDKSLTTEQAYINHYKFRHLKNGKAA